MSEEKTTKKKDTAITKRKAGVAERFIGNVAREAEAAIGQKIQLSQHEKKLATNMFLRIDAALEQHEADRVRKGNKQATPYTWDNVNLRKLSLDALHRIRLGLDAMVPNHIHVVPYINRKTNKYDVDLQIGFKGKHFYRVRTAVEEIEDIRYQVVHESDKFKAMPKSHEREVETYLFDYPDDVFSGRGKVIGGFGYVMYDDPRKNKLILVYGEQFQKAKNAAPSTAVWGKYYDEMVYKTLVHRVTEKLDVDPAKMSESYHYVEAQDDVYEEPLPAGPEHQIEDPEQRQTVDFDDVEPEVEEEEKSETPGKEKLDREVEEEGLPFKG